jgi:uncharacterized protein YqjF (DUF2071 family)
LTARWEHLLFLSYDCPPAYLVPFVPAGTALDAWNGHTFVSLVAFWFRDTRVRNVAIPFHQTFEEVNLRFYVRREAGSGELRRAVVFLKELVPRRAIAAVARWLYNEPYQAVPMSHSIAIEAGRGGSIAYRWRYRGRPYQARAIVTGGPEDPPAGSAAEFITEHYWGYTRQRDGGTLEYRVEHPRWPVWTPTEWSLDGRLALLYGEALGGVLSGSPVSVLAAAGSGVRVHSGTRIGRSRGTGP